MRSPANSQQFDASLAPSVFMQSNTVRPGQGRRLSKYAEIAAIDSLHATANMFAVDGGLDPVTQMRVQMQDSADTRSARYRDITSQGLAGIRRQRTTRGLGAVDCSTYSAAALSQDQVNAMVALALSISWGPDVMTHLLAASAQCWYFDLFQTMPTTVSPQAVQAVQALAAAGFTYPGASPDQLNNFVTKLMTVAKGGPDRLVELAKCGAAITAVNGWANYGELWAQSECMSKSWYENPWYLGAGAAVVIGAVWFATRKKKVS